MRSTRLVARLRGHSQAENLSMVSGALYLGDGDRMETAKAHALKPGGDHCLPRKALDHAFTKTPTVVPLHGEGPFDITCVNSEDDSSKLKAY